MFFALNSSKFPPSPNPPSPPYLSPSPSSSSLLIPSPLLSSPSPSPQSLPSLTYTQQRLCRPIVEPVDGTAVYKGRKVPESVSKGFP